MFNIYVNIHNIINLTGRHLDMTFFKLMLIVNILNRDSQV